MITNYEKEKGIVFNEDLKVTDKTSEKKLEELASDDSNYTVVDYDSRVKFLEDNGYEVTRETLADVSLASRPELEAPVESDSDEK